ncbi:UvrD-helicase domain-containing protein, partial [Fructobacillus ficulneus]
MARQYTENQSKAIDHQGHNILVAASAGSGKTTVLIERLVRKILAGDRVDQFLIVTFTNAAAAEMKERLEVAITDQIAQTSGDQKRFLQDQLALLPVANVSTIDSFALKLIDTYYYKIGLDPSYRLLADQAEVALLKDSVVQGVLADFYDPDHPDHQAFLDLVNNFANPNYDADLKANVLRLADFAVARPDGAEWLAALAAPGQSADPVAVSDRADYRKFLQPKVLSAVTQASAAFDLVLADLEGLPELEKTYNFIAETKERLAAINTAIASQASYDDLRALVDSDWGKMPQSKTAKVFKEDPDLAALLDHARSTFNAFFAKSGTVGAVMALKKTVFALSEDQWQVVNTAGDKLVTTLVKVTQAFLAAFTAQKRADNLLDFADAEQLSLQILDQDDVRELVQSQFKELLIDEYQDINRLQESFLQKLSNQHNMYMVGDVKQSIYGFRQADPSLFTGKYFAFAQEGSEDERIELAENFRSENNVTTVINQIFTQLMDQELGDIPYQDSAKLIAAASYPDFVPPVFQVNLIEQADGESADFAGNENADEEADGDSADQPEKRASQYQLLAQKVQDLIKNSQVYDQKAGVMRPVRYSDIAILTRSKGGYVELIRHFNTAGIPIQSDGVGNYYQVMEVYLVLDMLRVIDNPHQDIPLAAVLRSPIFGLTENDLAEIRLADRDHDFYTALVAWAQTKPQGQGILLALEAWQRLARQNDLVGLVLAIYQDTGWLDYVGT